jgi:hypothetical protein
MKLTRELLSAVALVAILGYYTVAVLLFGRDAAGDMLDDEGGAL